ncbi:Homoserine O-acetyltransferase [Labilithrix luteola]|uniref:Homoserine O-acetyltransferase n=1 Tax=Labilithrix luteola TaxID=1391654 RepID=A0A0K1PL60_9BACT|nr:alpha/beta fold hydrolase [Labilithrix luteola]AKU94146.1 Homoserine O-acetyltransferase [Labilithrix luteola]
MTACMLGFRYGYRDMVDIHHRLVTEVLVIRRLRAIFGMSMGGMHAWLWAESYPDEVEAIMPVVALPTRIAGGEQDPMPLARQHAGDRGR